MTQTLLVRVSARGTPSRHVRRMKARVDGAVRELLRNPSCKTLANVQLTTLRHRAARGWAKLVITSEKPPDTHILVDYFAEES